MILVFDHFPREISGLRWRSSLVVIRGCFPNSDGQQNFVPNYDGTDKNINNTSLLEKKVFFHIFRMRWRRSISDIFVERIQLYHNLTVLDKCIFINGDMGLDKKTPRSVGNRVVPNSGSQLFFVPNSDGKLNFVLDSVVSCFAPNSVGKLFLVPNSVGKHNFIPNSVGKHNSIPNSVGKPFFVPNYDGKPFLALISTLAGTRSGYRRN
jgi:hypothetical protein